MFELIQLRSDLRELMLWAAKNEDQQKEITSEFFPSLSFRELELKHIRQRDSPKHEVKFNWKANNVQSTNIYFNLFI